MDSMSFFGVSFSLALKKKSEKLIASRDMKSNDPFVKKVISF